ncbi:hypothetical protein C0991_003094, partial [Blastosporella zonata]
ISPGTQAEATSVDVEHLPPSPSRLRRSPSLISSVSTHNSMDSVDVDPNLSHAELNRLIEELLNDLEVYNIKRLKAEAFEIHLGAKMDEMNAKLEGLSAQIRACKIEADELSIRLRNAGRTSINYKTYLVYIYRRLVAAQMRNSSAVRPLLLLVN